MKWKTKHLITILPIAITVIVIGNFIFFSDKMELSELNEKESETVKNISYHSSLPPSTTNFTLSEFKCKDGTAVPRELWGNLQHLMNNLQVLRDELNAPIYINSGYRTPSHNKKIGGADNSMHLKSMAGDITAKGYTPTQVYNTILKLIKAGKMQDGGLSKYPTFVHYDIGSPRRW